MESCRDRVWNKRHSLLVSLQLRQRSQMACSVHAMEPRVLAAAADEAGRLRANWLRITWRVTGHLLVPRGRESVTPVLIASAPPNQGLKVPARVDCGMNLSSARRSLSAIR